MTEPTPAATETDTQDTPAETQPKPTETVDFWKQKAREQEKRAKENADAAKRLAEIEEANKSETQKAAERLAAAEKEAADARREALRLRIATRFQIGDEDADLFLTGEDEETLTRQAERLTAREADRRRNGNHVPREGATTTSVEGGERELVRNLFNG
jgi:hypothetical protein